MAPTDRSDLGFTVRVRKNGDVEVLHHGKHAATIRRPEAAALVQDFPDMSDPAAQQALARITGNFKRGNERRAAAHPRNAG